MTEDSIMAEAKRANSEIVLYTLFYTQFLLFLLHWYVYYKFSQNWNANINVFVCEKVLGLIGGWVM